MSIFVVCNFSYDVRVFFNNNNVSCIWILRWNSNFCLSCTQYFYYIFFSSSSFFFYIADIFPSKQDYLLIKLRQIISFFCSGSITTRLICKTYVFSLRILSILCKRNTVDRLFFFFFLYVQKFLLVLTIFFFLNPDRFDTKFQQGS